MSAWTPALSDNYLDIRVPGRAEALRRSQLALAGGPETSHPAFWAPFVLIGRGSPPAPPPDGAGR